MSFNQTCMLSNTPISENSEVQLFFLVSDGVYNQPIFSKKIFYPWDTCKILGGISLSATYKERNEFIIENNDKSKYILSLIREDQENQSLTFDEIFETLISGKIKLNNTINKNAYISIGLIHSDIYQHMINFQKGKMLPIIEKQLSDYIKFRDITARKIYSKSHTNEEFEQEKDDMTDFNIGFLNEYVFKLMVEKEKPFVYFKKECNLSDNEALKMLVDDMLIINIFLECSISLAPKIPNDVHSDKKLMKELFSVSKKKLHKG